MGRPSLPDDEAKTTTFSLKVSRAELAEWKEAAAALGVTPGEWLRQAAAAALRAGVEVPAGARRPTGTGS